MRRQIVPFFLIAVLFGCAGITSAHSNHSDTHLLHEDAEGPMPQTEEALVITEKLGQAVALDTIFIDEEGTEIHLRDLINKPTLLLPVYFTCPSSCDVMQGGMTRILPDVDLRPGEDYQVISVSFDPKNSPELAKSKKHNFMSAMGGAFPSQGWHFLTGTDDNIQALMDSIGFRYRKEGDLYLHPMVAIAIAPSGKIVRYLYGIDFLPFDITMAMTEAAEGKSGLSIKRVLAYCFSYDPEGQRYVVNVTRIAGVTILAVLATFALALTLGGKKRRNLRKKVRHG